MAGKLLALKLSPKRFLSCATMTKIAVDDEKAETTGIEMKSTRNPA
jgi:hypothetical protein